jgi:radical SAM superfamily enzyme YgiQ (UPF0313 family)
MRALLVSTYDLGHQPFGLASPAAWLRRCGIDVSSLDLAKAKLVEEVVRSVGLIAFHLPMHTATRLAAPVIQKTRALNPDARICAYGLYAPLNATWLRSLGVDDVLGAEFEEELAAIAHDVASAKRPEPRTSDFKVQTLERKLQTSILQTSNLRVLPRLQFLVPDRSGLPPLERYATLTLSDGSHRVVGYTEASRGCRHQCRHCPVVPVYDGQFRIVQPGIVLADVAAQVASGAGHITFGDPDFFNGPTHAMRVVEALHAAHPTVTYDVTIKIEHLLRHRDLVPRLRETGCLFVTSAVESIDDRVLAILDKGHTRADFLAAVQLCRDADLTLVPTFVAFHPWQTLRGYCELLDEIAALDLIDHVAPVQLTIRLLLPQGSRLLERDEIRPFVEPFDGKTLAYPWKHPDERVDRLHAEVVSVVGGRLTSDRRAVFEEITRLAHHRAGVLAPAIPAGKRAPVPQLNEPWYCCAEPNPEQLRLV